MIAKADMNYFESSATSARDDLIDLIPQNVANVLEVGAGVGKMGANLRRRGFKKIVGIEISKEAGDKATQYYDELIVGDVENLQLKYPDGYFDCIIYADVLEHLIDPWKVIKEQRKYLSEGGCIVASIPNIRYYKVLRKLVFKGDWDYQNAGILDRTHLRFFTIKTIKKMFESNGYRILKIVKKPTCGYIKRIVNEVFFGLFTDFFVGQYKFLAKVDSNKMQ